MYKLKDFPTVIVEVTAMRKFPDRLFLKTPRGRFLTVSVESFVAMLVDTIMAEGSD